MNSSEYVNMELRNLLGSNRPNARIMPLSNFGGYSNNPYEGGCGDCPYCGKGGEIIGGVVGTQADRQRFVRYFRLHYPTMKEGIRNKLYQSIPSYGLTVSEFINNVDNGTITLPGRVELTNLTVPLPNVSEDEKAFFDNPDAEEQEVHNEIKNVINTISENPKEISPEVAQTATNLISAIEQGIPDFSYIKSVKDLNEAKKLIKDAYKRCLKSVKAGKKRDSCNYLTIRYITQKLKYIDSLKKGAKKLRYNKHNLTRNQLIAIETKRLKNQHPHMTYANRRKAAMKIIR